MPTKGKLRKQIPKPNGNDVEHKIIIIKKYQLSYARTQAAKLESTKKCKNLAAKLPKLLKPTNAKLPKLLKPTNAKT